MALALVWQVKLELFRWWRRSNSLSLSIRSLPPPPPPPRPPWDVSAAMSRNCMTSFDSTLLNMFAGTFSSRIEKRTW